MISNFKVEKSTSYECIINQWSRNWSRPDQQADKIRLHDTNTIRMEIHTNTCYSGVFINADFNPFKHVRCSVLPCIVSVIRYVPNTQLHKGERVREGGVSERRGSPIRCYVHCVALLSTKESSILQKRTKTPNFLPFSQLVQTKWPYYELSIPTFLIRNI